MSARPHLTTDAIAAGIVRRARAMGRAVDARLVTAVVEETRDVLEGATIRKLAGQRLAKHRPLPAWVGDVVAALVQERGGGRLTVEGVVAPGKERWRAEVRQEIGWVLCWLGLSQPNAGRAVNRTHRCIFVGIAKTNARIAADPGLCATLRAIGSAAVGDELAARRRSA